MEENKGYIYISRSLPEHWIWENEHDLKRWLDLLYMASWKDHKIRVGRFKPFVLKRGDLVGSIPMLAKRWNDSKPTVVKFLKLLENDGMIIRKTVDNVIGIITICNYDTYQKGVDNPVDNPVDTLVDNLVDNPVDTKQKKGNNKGEEREKKGEEREKKGKDISILSSDDDATIAKQDETELKTDAKQRTDKDKKEKSDGITGSVEGKNGDKINIANFVKFWNETVKGTYVPQIKVFSDRRKKMLKARLKEYGKRKIFDAIEIVPKSDFLSGRKTDFRASFDFVFGPENFPKVIEGNYNNTERMPTLDQRMQVGLDVPLRDFKEFEGVDTTDILNPKRYK